MRVSDNEHPESALTSTSRADRVRVVSLDVDVVNRKTVISSVHEMRTAGGGYVCVSNVHMVMEAYDHPEYQNKVNNADLVIPDGMPLVWMQNLRGRKDAARVRGNDLTKELLYYAATNGLTVGFYGGTPSVIDLIRERASRELPDLNIVYAYSPPFRPLTVEEDTDVVDSIKAANPDLLFVGLGCPKQENWMADHRDRLSCVMLGVGAAFDFYAGNVRECPAWLGRLGLEWLFRLTQEPKRLWRRYLILNPRFVMFAMAQLLGFGRSRR